MPFASETGFTVMVGHTRTVMGRVVAHPLASTARTVTLTPAPFAVVGVPLSTPAVESVNPAGKVPALMVKV